MRLPYTNIFLLHAYHKNHKMTLDYKTHSNKNIIQSNRYDNYPQFQGWIQGGFLRSQDPPPEIYQRSQNY